MKRRTERTATAVLTIMLAAVSGCGWGPQTRPHDDVECAERRAEQAGFVWTAAEATDWPVRRSAVANLTCPELLADVAIENKCPAARRAAVERLTDQSVLAKIAAKDANTDVRITALDRLTDEELLAEIAAGHRDRYTRLHAVRGLSNPDALVERVLDEEEICLIRRTALSNLTDQGALAKIAKNSSIHRCREAAMRRLTDREALRAVAIGGSFSAARTEALDELDDAGLTAELAVNDKNPRMRASATRRLTDQDVLKRLALESECMYVRSAAVTVLEDQKLIAEIAEKDEMIRVRRAAAGVLTDQRALGKVALTDNSHLVRRIALENLTDAEALAWVAANDIRIGDRKLAVEKIEVDEADDLLRDIALLDESMVVRQAAAEKVLDAMKTHEITENDKTLLKKLAFDDENSNIRFIAVEKISDPGLLAKIAINDTSPRVRRAAVRKITDPALLTRIIEECNHYLAVPRIDFEVNIDADLSKWKDVPSIRLGSEDNVFPEEHREYWQGPGDFSAEMYLAWDDMYFYMAAEVVDDTHFNPAEGDIVWEDSFFTVPAEKAGEIPYRQFHPRGERDIWKGDSLIFSLAMPTRSGKHAPRGAKSRSSHFHALPNRFGAYSRFSDQGLALGDDGVLAYQWKWVQAGGLMPGSKYAVVRDEESGKTYYEARLPFESLFRKYCEDSKQRVGIEPEPGDVLGFSAAVIDVDGEQGRRRLQIHPAMSGWRRPFLGRMQLPWTPWENRMLPRGYIGLVLTE